VLLERESELGSIEAALAGAASGHGSVLVVEGAAGIGKSSLLAAAAERAHGMRVLRARGSPLEQAYAFGTVRTLFDPIRATADWDALTADAAALARHALDPAPAAFGPGDDATHATLHGLFWLTANLCAERPLVLVVDDAHWADPPSLRWLGHLARRIDTLPLLALVAVRSGEPPSDPRLLDDLLTAPSLRPQPLGLEATATLLRARLEATDAVCAACHEATGGNPFLVTAIASALAAGADPATIGQFGPDAVAREVARRLDRLPAGAREVTLAVAILGPGAAPRHVAALAGRSADSAAAAADALRTAGLLAPGTTLEFAHPILAAAVAAGLGPGQTALAHRRAWRLLHVDGAEPERQALQLLQAEPEADPTAVAVLRAAAQAANARGAPESATAYLRRALAEPPDAATRPDVLLECGLALAAHRHSDSAALLRESIELTPDPAARADAALRAARALALAALYDDMAVICRLALADTCGARPETVARLEVELVGLGMTRAHARAEGQAVIERARRDPPPVGLWRVNAAGLDTFANRPAAETLALLHSVDITEELESIVATVVLGLMLVWNDDLESTLAHTEGLLAACRPLGWASAVANCQWLRAMAVLRAGRVAEAADDARAAYEFKLRVSPPHSRAWAVTPLAEALIESDDLDAAEAVLANIDTLEPGLLVRPTLFEARARLRLAQQRPREALADARAAAADWEELQCDGAGLALWRVHAVEALVALGEREEARALAAEQLALAERHGALTSLAVALRAVAHAAAPSDAIATLERAAALFAAPAASNGAGASRDGAGAPGVGRLEHVRVLLDLGAALRRRGRTEAAREPLREALHLADQGGAVRLAERARAELHAAGARPRRAALTGRGALTPAERRVATLAAEGRTNRQIAQELFVTQRTVETHLTHTFAKLDVSSRDALAAALWPAPVPV
jgi:DNA-binding CsgD family transcriptional regulator/tetratricopeptide (TPR) repeat protein